MEGRGDSRRWRDLEGDSRRWREGGTPGGVRESLKFEVGVRRREGGGGRELLYVGNVLGRGLLR